MAYVFTIRTRFTFLYLKLNKNTFIYANLLVLYQIPLLFYLIIEIIIYLYNLNLIYTIKKNIFLIININFINKFKLINKILIKLIILLLISLQIF